mgnify:CR=1 FL=1
MDHAHLLVILDRQKKLPHVVRCLPLVKNLVGLLDDPVEHGLPLDLLHDQVDVLVVIIRFIILDNIWMIELIENCNFLHD